MERVLILLKLFIAFFTFPAEGQEQLQKVEGEGIINSDIVYVNEDGDKYAYAFYVAFHNHVLTDSDRVQSRAVAWFIAGHSTPSGVVEKAQSLFPRFSIGAIHV